MNTAVESNSYPVNLTLVRTAGVLAVIGGLVNAVSDYLLQGGLIARSAVNTYEHLAFAPYDLVALGSIIGNLALPFWLLGFLPLYIALAPAGRWLSIPPVACLGYVFSLFPGYHGSYALYAAGFHAQREAPPELLETVTNLTERLHAYHDMQISVISVCIVVGSLWFLAAVLSGRTHFSRWMVLLCPIMAPIAQQFIEMLPAPYGGFIRPAWGTILYSLLFLVATTVTWHGGGARIRSPKATAF